MAGQFDQVLLVECKNWSGPVGYPELAVFQQQTPAARRLLGVLVAAHGITGKPEELTGTASSAPR